MIHCVVAAPVLHILLFDSDASSADDALVGFAIRVAPKLLSRLGFVEVVHLHAVLVDLPIRAGWVRCCRYADLVGAPQSTIFQPNK